MKPRKHKRYGWIPSLPDKRDLIRAPKMGGIVPQSVDLRQLCPPVYDQGQLGSCTANAIAGAIEFDQLKQGFKPPWTPSRLFIYYQERFIEGTVGTDSGAMIRDGIKVIATLGAPPEPEWPYDISQFAVAPNDQSVQDAIRNLALKYESVNQTLQDLLDAIAGGFPVVFGFTVYDSFESQVVAQTGVMPMPNLDSESVLGGHAVLAVGYDQDKKIFIVRNSWGDGWGDHGYFYMPFNYISDSSLASDFWTVTQMQ